MSNEQGKYKRRQWKKKGGGQQLTPISLGNIGPKQPGWAIKRKRAKRQQG